MSIQSEADWRGLRRAAAVARETLDALEAAVRAGFTTLDLDRVAAAIFTRRGARSVLTIEPLISAGSPDVVQDRDGWTLRTADGSLAAHHEHTLVITRGAPILLTAA